MNDYWSGSSTAINSGYVYVEGQAGYESVVSYQVKNEGTYGIHPKLYFKYIKRKFGFLEKRRLDTRLKKLEKAFYKALENGQEAFAEKFLNKLAQETRESAILAKGINIFIEKDDINKYKNKIRDGHISDTQLKDFTRIIPKKVLEKKKKVENIFDGFVIYHYWDEDAKDVKKMDKEEKEKMKDPVLFGWIKETNRLYFIADWEDEYCDLTIDEMIDVIGKDDEEITLQKEPDLTLPKGKKNEKN